MADEPTGGAPAGQQNNTGAGGSGSQGDSWRNSLPEDIRTNPALESVQDIASLAKGYVDLHSKVPKVPESVDGYTIAAPEGASVSENEINEIRSTAAELGLTVEQANKLLQKRLEQKAQQQDRAQRNAATRLADAEAALKKEWGEQYEHNLNVAETALQKLADDELKQLLVRSGMNANPAVIKFLHKIGSVMTEEQLATGRAFVGSKRPLTAEGRPRLRFRSMGDK